MKKNESNIPFSERHPRINFLLGLIILIVIVVISGYLIWMILSMIVNVGEQAIALLKKVATSMDAVVIVALITGCVSIIGFIINSIVSKIIEYRKNRQDYLAKKREIPYGEFVEMIYKVQQNSKQKGSYTEKQMIEDLSRFSRQITLWGSKRVVKKWVKFRENGANPEAAHDNLFLMEEIMNDMRKDLGLKKVKKGELLSFFVNDVKSAMKK